VSPGAPQPGLSSALGLPSAVRRLPSTILFHQADEVVKQVVGIVRTRRSLGVILDRKGREPSVAKTLQGLVIQVHVSQFDLVRVQRSRIDGEAVIVAGDFDLTSEQVLHGLVASPMTELELVGSSP
jgi:hypothetical protein